MTLMDTKRPPVTEAVETCRQGPMVADDAGDDGHRQRR